MTRLGECAHEYVAQRSVILDDEQFQRFTFLSSRSCIVMKVSSSRPPQAFSAVVVLVLTFLNLSRALAGPPFVTDDPVPTDYRDWEIYAGLQYENATGGDTPFGAPFLELNYGAMPNVQVSMSTALGDDGTPAVRRYGGGGIEFGIKTRFVQEAGGWPQISFYPSVSFPTTAGDHAVTFLPLWMQKTSGPWTAFGGGGVYLNRSPGERDSTLFGLALERTLSPHLTVGVELYHQSADEIGGTDTTAANLGAIAPLGRYHAILFSAGRGFHGNDAFSAYASYEFALGPGASSSP